MFNLILIIAFSINSIHCTSNWRSGGAGSSEEEKQLNFYGKLSTHQGQEEAIAHILIDGKHKDIIMYDAPVKHAQQKFNEKTKQTEIKLDENPITDFVQTKIDLNAISTLKVPNPNTVWIYQKEKKSHKIEFILVTITLKEGSATKQYLLDRKMHISCSAVDNGSEKKEVPLSAVDTLTLEGYSFALEEEKTKAKKAPCPAKENN